MTQAEQLPEPELLTAKEVGARLQVSKMTVYRLAHAGRLRHCRLGRSIRIFPDSVDELIERSAVT